MQKQHWRHHHHQRNQQQQQQQQQQEKHQQQQQLKTFTRAVLSLEKRANARIRGRKNRLERFYTKILLIKRPSLLDLAQFGTNFYMIFVSSPCPQLPYIVLIYVPSKIIPYLLARPSQDVFLLPLNPWIQLEGTIEILVYHMP